MAQPHRTISTALVVLMGAALLLLSACGGGSVSSANHPVETPLSSLALSPATLTVLRGNSGTSMTVAEDFQNAVSLTFSGVPAGTSVSFDPGTIPSPGSGSSTMTIGVGVGTHTGSYSIVVTGSAGGIQKTAQLMLNVTAQVFLHWSRSESDGMRRPASRRDAIRSQVIDALEAQTDKETGT